MFARYVSKRNEAWAPCQDTARRVGDRVGDSMGECGGGPSRGSWNGTGERRWTPSGKRIAAAGGSPTRLRGSRGSPRPRTPGPPSCPSSITARRGSRSPAWSPSRQGLGRPKSLAAPLPIRMPPEPATWARRRPASRGMAGWGRPTSRYPTARARPRPRRRKVNPGVPSTRASASPPTPATAPSRPLNARSSKNSVSASSPACSTMASRAS